MESQKMGSEHDEKATPTTKHKGDYIGWAIGVIAILVAIWTYHLSEQHPLLSYSVDANRARIVNTQTGVIPDLTVQYKGRTISNSDVTVATIYLWNAGNAPTHHNQILKPLTIELLSKGTILDATVTKQTRDVCALQLQRTDKPNSLSLDFNILEPKDGAAVQVIYSGDADATIELKGLIEGQSQIRFVGLTTPQKSLLSRIASVDWRASLDWHFALGAALLSIGLIYIIVRVISIFTSLIWHFFEGGILGERMAKFAERRLYARDQSSRFESIGVWFHFCTLLAFLIGQFLLLSWSSGTFTEIPFAILGGKN